MEKTISLARKHSDQAELYSLEQTQNMVRLEDAKLKDIQSTMQSGTSIRLLKNQKLGFAYTRSLNNREELVQNALASLKGGVDVKFDLPLTTNVPTLNTYDDNITQTTNTAIVNECRRIFSFLEQKTKGQVNIHAGTITSRMKIVNTAGTNLSTNASYYSITVMILYPGSATGIDQSFAFKTFQKVDEAHLNTLAELYNQGEKELEAAGGRLKVLFMPDVMYALVWRLQSATSGESLYHKQSPLANRLGERIFSEKLTVVDDPLDDTKPGARAFDDEGVACKRRVIVDKGILKNYYYDLNYAAKLNVEPSGHGFKTSRWATDTISIEPTPALRYITFEKGKKTFRQLIHEMDKGIIICGALGAHSGNIPNGDFSIGLAPGLYVENGEIVGRIKDAMIAGNIYEIMKRVIGIENAIHPAYTGYYPAVLFEDINVATKS
jgi:PmbA protein